MDGARRDPWGLAQEFQEKGFLVLPSILSPDHVADCSAAVDRDLDRYPEDWADLESFCRSR